MAVAFKITKAVYDKLSDELKKEYKASGDDYQLDVEGYEDPVALRNARDHEKEEAKQAKAAAAAEKKRADTAESKARDLEAAGGSVDAAVAAKEKEWKDRYDKDISEANGKFDGLRTSVINTRRSSLADSIANKISTNPDLISEKIAKRIDVEFDDKTGEVKHFVFGADGKRSNASVEDLEKECLRIKEWAPILKGTRANGGGGAPASQGGGSAPRSTTPLRPGTPPDDLTKLSGRDMADRIKELKEQKAGA